MAKVTATNGRFGGTCFRTSDFFRAAEEVGRAEARPSESGLLFFLGDFMLDGFVLLFHVAHPDMAGGATWFVEEINDAAGEAANQDNDETSHADESRGGEPIIG